MKHDGHSLAKIAKEQWMVVLYTCVAITCTLFLVAETRGIGAYVFSRIAVHQGNLAQKYLAQEEQKVSESVEAISRDPALVDALANRRVHDVETIAGNEQVRTGLSAYTVTGPSGVALSRTVPGSNVGDNVFLTNPIGRNLLEKQSSVGYAPGKYFSLTLTSGSVVRDSQENIVGAVFGGYWLDNKYAENFKKKYLHDWRNREVIFYSKEDGVTGSSIEDVDVRNKFRAYLSHASTFIQDGGSGRLFTINGTDYVVANHFLEGSNEIYGGVIILMPVPLTISIRSGIVALVVSLGFFATLLFIERISFRQLVRFRRKTLYSFLFILTGVVFIATWSGVYLAAKSFSTSLNTPTYTIYNSTMKLRPGSGVFGVGYQQQASILVYSGGESINAVETGISFDPKKVSVDSLSLDRSICDPVTIIDKTIDNKVGHIHIACAVVSRTFSDPRGVVADINFTPKKEGDIQFYFDEDTHVLAADGLGTDVLRSVTSAYYRVFDEDDMSNFFSTSTIVVPFSPTHDNSSTWYSSRNINVVWSNPLPGLSYEYEFNQLATTTMVSPVTTAKTSFTTTVSKDGVYYFKILPKKDGKRGGVTLLKIQIDTTPPDLPLIKASSLHVRRNDVARFEFSSDDEGSGLQRNFYISIDGSAWLPSAAKVYIPFPQSGKHVVSVRVFDNAENYSDAQVTVVVD